MPKQIVKIDRFEGGISEASDPRDIAPNELSKAIGVSTEDLGKIKLIGKNDGYGITDKTSMNIKAGYGLFQFNHDYEGAGDTSDVTTGVDTVDTLVASTVEDLGPGEYSNVTLYETETSGTLSNPTDIRAHVTINSITGTNLEEDLDGSNDYTWVNIGDLDWLTQNWRATTLMGGTSGGGSTANIDEQNADADWISTENPARANPNGDASQVARHGLLYNREAIKHEHFPPQGWRVATNDDWKNLEGAWGMSVQNQNADGWRTFDGYYPGQNFYFDARYPQSFNFLDWTNIIHHYDWLGFNIVGAGRRNGWTGAYEHHKEYAGFWANQEIWAPIRRFRYNNGAVESEHRADQCHVNTGYSVRLCRDAAGETVTPTIDGSSIVITSSGNGRKASNSANFWAVDDELFIKATDLGDGGGGTDYLKCDIATLIRPSYSQLFDNYILLHDNHSSSPKSYVYSNKNTSWSVGLDTITSTTSEPNFTLIDGTLRISDGNYQNSTMFYSYIKRTRFLNYANTDQTGITGTPDGDTGLSITNPGPDVIIRGESSSGAADGMRITGTNIPANTRIVTVTSATELVLSQSTSSGSEVNDIRIFSENSLSYEEEGWNMTSAILNPISLQAFNFKQNPNTDNTVDTDGAIIICLEEYDESGYQSNWVGKNWEFAMSTIYDDIQESPLAFVETYNIEGSYSNQTHFIGSNASDDHGYRLKFQIRASKQGDLPARVTGFKVYAREYLGESTDWYLQARYDLEKGGRGVLSSKEVPWHDMNNTTVYTRPEVKDFNELITYTLETGYPTDNITENQLTPKYKTGVVANRKLYVAAPQIVDNFGNIDIKSDAMMKSHVNRFDTFTTDRMVEASVQDGDRIVKLEEYADRILQFKENKLHIINISQDIEFLEDTLEHRGISNPNAATKTDIGIAFLNKYGAFLYNGKETIDLLQKQGRRLIREDTWAGFISDVPSVSYLPKSKKIIFCDCGDGTDAYIYDLITQAWSYSNEAFEAADKTNMVLDWNGDLIYQIAGDMRKFNVSPSSTSSGSLDVRTKDIDFGSPGVRKKIYKVYITYKSGGSTTNVQVKYDVDGAQSFSKLFKDGDNFASNELAHVNSNWTIAELKPSTSSQANNIKSFALRFSCDGAVPSGFEINDISIVYRVKGIK